MELLNGIEPMLPEYETGVLPLSLQKRGDVKEGGGVGGSRTHDVPFGSLIKSQMPSANLATTPWLWDAAVRWCGGWAGRTRTFGCGGQSSVTYHLSTAQQGSVYCLSRRNSSRRRPTERLPLLGCRCRRSTCQADAHDATHCRTAGRGFSGLAGVGHLSKSTLVDRDRQALRRTPSHLNLLVAPRGLPRTSA